MHGEPNEDDCWEALELAAKRKGNGFVYHSSSSGRVYWCTPLRIKLKLGTKLEKLDTVACKLNN